MIIYMNRGYSPHFKFNGIKVYVFAVVESLFTLLFIHKICNMFVYVLVTVTLTDDNAFRLVWFIKVFSLSATNTTTLTSRRHSWKKF